MGERFSIWWHGMGRYRRQLFVTAAILFALLFLFANLTEDLLEHELAAFDWTIIMWVRTLQSPGMTSFMLAVTALGSPLVLTVLALAGISLFYRRGHRWEPLALMTSMIGGWAWDEVMKRFFHRLRPPGPWLAAAGGYSFPSGHSVVAVGFYGVLAYFLTGILIPKAWRAVAVSVAGLLVVLIGISRIYLGVHYPSDVVGGFALGGAWGGLCVLIGRAWDRARN